MSATYYVTIMTGQDFSDEIIGAGKSFTDRRAAINSYNDLGSSDAEYPEFQATLDVDIDGYGSTLRCKSVDVDYY